MNILENKITSWKKIPSRLRVDKRRSQGANSDDLIVLQKKSQNHDLFG